MCLFLTLSSQQVVIFSCCCCHKSQMSLWRISDVGVVVCLTLCIRRDVYTLNSLRVFQRDVDSNSSRCTIHNDVILVLHEIPCCIVGSVSACSDAINAWIYTTTSQCFFFPVLLLGLGLMCLWCIVESFFDTIWSYVRLIVCQLPIRFYRICFFSPFFTLSCSAGTHHSQSNHTYECNDYQPTNAWYQQSD